MLVEGEVFKLKVSKVLISYEYQVFKKSFGVSFANYRNYLYILSLVVVL